MRSRLLLVASLTSLATAAAAVPTVADACSFPRGVRRVDTLPPDRAADVPLNAGVHVTYQTFGEPWPYEQHLTLRAAGTTAIIPAQLIREPMPWSTSVTLQPDGLLAPETTYEVLDTVPADCLQPIAECPAGAPAVIATFTTGTTIDRGAPSTGAVALDSAFEDADASGCSWGASRLVHRIAVAGARDDRPASWLRVRIYDAEGRPLTGAFSLDHLNRIDNPLAAVALGHECTGGPGGPPSYLIPVANDQVIVRAVDLAGNEDTAAPVLSAQTCSDFDADGDGHQDPPPILCDGGVGGGTDSGGGGVDGTPGGCSSARPGDGSVFAIGIALGLVMLLRRRRSGVGR